MVVVLDASDRLAGVVTKGDVVAQISHCQGASCVTSTSVVMTREAEICRPPEGFARSVGSDEGPAVEEFSGRGRRTSADRGAQRP
jgi:hypothetical protein